MNVIKRIFSIIFEPVRFVGSRNVSNLVVKFFDRNKWLTYVVAFVVTVIIFLVKYM